MSRRRTLATAAAVLAFAGILVPATPAAAATGCRVDYRVTSQWPGGFQGEVTIRNLGAALTAWRLEFDFPTTGQRVTNGWWAAWGQQDTHITATNQPWNGNLPTDGSVTAGFIGAFSGTNPAPTAFTLNGGPCTGEVNIPETPPVVSITSPAQFTEYGSPATIEITATAADADGFVSKVEFFAGTTSLGTDTTAPYTHTIIGLAVTEFTTLNLSAKVTDNSGISMVSARVMIFVYPPPTDELVLRGTVLRSQLCLYMAGPDGWTYLLDAQADPLIREGARLEVRGIPHPEWWTVCDGGTPFEVLSVQPL